MVVGKRTVRCAANLLLGDVSEMILVVVCPDCGRKFELRLEDVPLAEVQEMGFRDKREQAEAAKKGFRCEDCSGSAPTGEQRLLRPNSPRHH